MWKNRRRNQQIVAFHLNNGIVNQSNSTSTKKIAVRRTRHKVTPAVMFLGQKESLENLPRCRQFTSLSASAPKQNPRSWAKHPAELQKLPSGSARTPPAKIQRRLYGELEMWGGADTGVTTYEAMMMNDAQHTRRKHCQVDLQS